MATEDDIKAARRDARLALLVTIKRAAESSDTTRALAAAEAYAWITSPIQPHGGAAS